MTDKEFIDLVIDTIDDYKQITDLSNTYFIERICDIVDAYKNGQEF